MIFGNGQRVFNSLQPRSRTGRLRSRRWARETRPLFGGGAVGLSYIYYLPKQRGRPAEELETDHLFGPRHVIHKVAGDNQGPIARVAHAAFVCRFNAHRHELEDVIDAQTLAGFAALGTFLGRYQRLAPPALLAEMCGDAFGGEEISVGYVSLTGVQLGFRGDSKRGRVECLAVVDGGGGDFGAQDECALQINVHTVLPALEGLLVYLGPAGVGIRVNKAFRDVFQFFGHQGLLDGVVVGLGVALARDFTERGVGDAAFARDESALGEVIGEGGDERIEQLCLVECFAKLAAGVFVGDGVGFGDVEDAVKASAVADLQVGLFVEPSIEGLLDEDFEHEQGMERRAAGGFRFSPGYANHHRNRYQPIRDFVQTGERIVLGFDLGQAVHGIRQSSFRAFYILLWMFRHDRFNYGFSAAKHLI